MFKLPDKFPNLTDDVSDITDFYEFKCLKSKRGRIPFREIYRAAAQGDDEVEINGIEDESDIFNNEKFDEVCAEIQRREQACGGNYPFSIENGGYALKLELPIESWATVNYAYLLLATRLNMRDDRTQNCIDGTLLFENFSAQVAKNYWGERANCLVFGTASIGASFPDKVNDLCKKLGEGTAFKTRNKSKPTEKDAKLDVVVWKTFHDERQSKLIGFGQCKTGTHWEESISQLQPDAFCRNWLEDAPAVSPVRLYFICDSFPSDQWYSKASNAGIIFDRFRIMDFLPSNLEDQLQDKVKKWVGAALDFIKS
ncbi:MAG: hypothetical protein ACKVUS_09870 [Saprospiraceae bacterium]